MGIISVKMVVVKGVDIPVLAKYVYRFTIALEYTYLGGIITTLMTSMFIIAVMCL